MSAASIPTIPRAQWGEHPNFPNHVLLLGSHENFRRISRLLCQDVADPERRARASLLYRRWIAAMRSHEGYEEIKLYPYLAARWGASFAPAEEGHHALHEADDAVRRAFADGDTAELARAMKAHDAVLDAHLDLEEELVIPLLLELSPTEFREFYNQPIGVLLRQFDGQTD